MCSHLKLLQEMYPDKIFLDSRDIAKVLGISHGHLLNMSMKKLIPFKLVSAHKKKIQVSVIEMARYLDTKIESENAEARSPALVPPVKKKLGRPRNSSR